MLHATESKRRRRGEGALRRGWGNKSEYRQVPWRGQVDTIQTDGRTELFKHKLNSTPVSKTGDISDFQFYMFISLFQSELYISDDVHCKQLCYTPSKPNH